MPYSLADTFVPKSKLRRSVGSEHTMDAAADAAISLQDARAARQEETDSPYETSPDPRGVTPDDIRSSALLGPQPEYDGRPLVPDSAATNATISRAARVGDESSVDDVARLAWQREAALNGNPAGDLTAPQAYIDSWKGQVRAGEDAGPIASLLRTVAQQQQPFNAAASGAADAQRRAAITADYQRRQAENSSRQGAAIRATTAPTVATTQGTISNVLNRPTAGEPGGPALADGPVLGDAPALQNLPDNGTAPTTTDDIVDRGNTSTGAQRFSLVDDVLRPAASAPTARLDHVDTSSRQGNLQSWSPALRATEAKTGLRADALAAIILAENGGGQSPLSSQDNNYFSITHVPGRKSQAGAGSGGRFAHYNTPQDSLDDFVDLVSTNPRYAEAWANRGDPDKFFAGLVKGGYIVPEPNFPVETWMKNLSAGRDEFNRAAPPVTAAASPQAPAQPSTTNFSMVDDIMNSRGKPAAAGLDVNGITKEYEGKPYVYGGAGGRSDMTPGAATDCSGFVASVWKNKFGLDLAAHTDTSYNQLKQMGATEVSPQDARPSDIVYYMGAGTGGETSHHMGIYAGNGQVLDMAVGKTQGVRTRDINHAGKFVILRDPRVKS